MMAAVPKAAGDDIFYRTAALLGGARVLKCQVQDPYEAHAAILSGLPVRTVVHLIRSLPTLGKDPSLPSALGIGKRTMLRWHEAPAMSMLSPAQSGRVWILAEIIARAESALGSQQKAEEWLRESVPSLNGHRPLDLLVTPAGTKLVADHLLRLEYGVYT